MTCIGPGERGTQDLPKGAPYDHDLTKECKMYTDSMHRAEEHLSVQRQHKGGTGCTEGGCVTMVVLLSANCHGRIYFIDLSGFIRIYLIEVSSPSPYH
jgi:hypothetical protein